MLHQCDKLCDGSQAPWLPLKLLCLGPVGSPALTLILLRVARYGTSADLELQFKWPTFLHAP